MTTRSNLEEEAETILKRSMSDSEGNPTALSLVLKSVYQHISISEESVEVQINEKGEASWKAIETKKL